MSDDYKPGAPKTERNHAIYEMRKDGATFSEIGRKYKIGVERVRQICLREERLEKFVKFKKKQGTRLVCQSIEHEFRKLDLLEDRRSMSGQRYADRLTEAQKKTIVERTHFLEAYQKIIEGD